MFEQQPQVTIIILTWNSMSDIAATLDAVKRQTYTNWTIMTVDNGSLDGTVKWMQENYPQVAMLKNNRNLGFARANNQALMITKSTYVLVLNDDVVLDTEWLSRGVDYLQIHQEYGVFGGKNRRFDYNADELKEVRFSDIIDSTGITINRSRHVTDRGSGERDRGQFDKSEDVFGISGACALYRREALESVRWKDEFFDNDFTSYKEDADLAWRLQRQGWKSWYDADALAYHHRSAKGISQTSNLMIARSHRNRRKQITYLSYRNHWLMLMKNESWSSLWRDFGWISFYELKKFGFLLVTNPKATKGLFDALGKWPLMRSKARLIANRAQKKPIEVRKWFIKSAA